MNDYWSDGSTSDGDDCSTFSSSSESSPDPFEYLGVPADSDFTSSEHSSGSASDSELGGAFTSSEHSSGSASDCDLDLFDTPFAEWNDDNLCLDLTVSSNLSPIIDTAERKLQDAPHSGVFMVAPSKQATGLDTKGYGTMVMVGDGATAARGELSPLHLFVTAQRVVPCGADATSLL